MRINKKEVVKMIKEAMTSNFSPTGLLNLEPEENVFRTLNQEGCFNQDKTYGLGNNIAEIFERIFEIQRLINNEEESLDLEMSQGLNDCMLLIRDTLKEHGKGI